MIILRGKLPSGRNLVRCQEQNNANVWARHMGYLNTTTGCRSFALVQTDTILGAMDEDFKLDIDVDNDNYDFYNYP